MTLSHLSDLAVLFTFAILLVMFSLPPLILLVLYFAIAIIGYVIQGIKKETDNQIKDMSAGMTALMWSLIIAEIGGFLILFYGVIVALT